MGSCFPKVWSQVRRTGAVTRLYKTRHPRVRFLSSGRSCILVSFRVKTQHESYTGGTSRSEESSVEAILETNFAHPSKCHVCRGVLLPLLVQVGRTHPPFWRSTYTRSTSELLAFKNLIRCVFLTMIFTFTTYLRSPDTQYTTSPDHTRVLSASPQVHQLRTKQP